MRVRLCTAEALALFDGDEEAALAPMVEELARTFAEAHHFAEVQSGGIGNDQGTWIAANGSFKRDGRNVAIPQVRGTSTELVVSALGSTEDAVQMLEAVWSSLVKLIGAPPRGLEKIATIAFVTTAIVECHKSFEALCPLAPQLLGAVTGGLKDQPAVEVGQTQYKFNIELPMRVARRNIPAHIAFEPRVNAKPGTNVFWTRSPLTSEQHLAMLERIIGERRDDA